MHTTTSTGTLRIAAGSASWEPRAGSYTWNDWGPQAGSSAWELAQAGAASGQPQAGATAGDTPRQGASAWR